MLDNFQQRKKDILSKLDKSSKKSWDKRILKLCEKLNKSKDYYTTSSCSGRGLLILDSDKKSSNLFLWVSHNLISLKDLKSALEKIKQKKLIRFKQEPCILHVACRDLGSAQNLLNKAKLVGWKKSGIISSGTRFVVELNSTEKLEFPILNQGKILVDDGFLKLVVLKSNENLKKNWKKIENLRAKTFI